MTKNLLVAAVATGLWIAPATPAGGAIDPKGYCPAGQTVVNATETVVNDPIYGIAGNAWATRKYDRNIVIVRTAPNTYCAATRDTGGFTTFAGASPGGLATIAAGRTGTLSGGIRTNVFRATFRPRVPTTGRIGTYDALGHDWRTLYFSKVGSEYDLT